FWAFIGAVNGKTVPNIPVTIDSVIGIKKTIADGIAFANSQKISAHAEMEVIGPVPVMYTVGSSRLNVAYTYETDSFKVVFHWPVIRDQYDEFMGRVVCKYFELCALKDVTSQAENAHAVFSLYPNPAANIVHIKYDSPNSPPRAMELISETGALISRFSLEN